MHWVFMFLVGAFLAFNFPSEPRAAKEPRFFGTYCGSHQETVRVRVKGPFGLVTWRDSTFTLEFSLRAHIDHRLSPRGNSLLLGSGTATLENENVPGWVRSRLPREARDKLTPGSRLPVSFSGAVTGTGRPEGRVVTLGNRCERGAGGHAEGTGRAPGWDAVRGDAHLLGETLSICAQGRVFELHKDRCGNRRPTASIEEPSAVRFPWGEPIDFRASASDSEDGSIPEERLVWISNVNGELGRGLRITRNYLSVGDHQITFLATDSGGRSIAASKRLIIENNLPRITIFDPEPGGAYYEGLPVTFRGRATDRETGNLLGDALVWTSSAADGTVGTGRQVTTTLPAGRHGIRLTASDGDASASESITIDVREEPSGNTRPAVTITSPRHYSGLSDRADDCFILVAEAHDLQDGRLSGGSITWEDRRDGVGTVRTFTGKRVEACGFAAGTHDTWHTIRVTATDSDGATATDEIRIYVIPGGLI